MWHLNLKGAKPEPLNSAFHVNEINFIVFCANVQILNKRLSIPSLIIFTKDNIDYRFHYILYQQKGRIIIGY